MNCEAFENFLDRFVEGNLESRESQACREHLRSCTGCARLAAIVRGQVDLVPPEEATLLTQAVLDRTSGRSCDRVREVLDEFLERGLSGGLSERVEEHLCHCKGCASLAAVLRVLSVELRQLAIIPPGDGFTEEMLALTSRRFLPWEQPSDVPLPYRLRSWWKLSLERPLFSWEAAYIGALVALLFFNGPFSSVQGLVAGPLSSVESELRNRAANTSVRLAERVSKTTRDVDELGTALQTCLQDQEAVLEKVLTTAQEEAIDLTTLLYERGREFGERAVSLASRVLEDLDLDPTEGAAGES